VIAVIVYHFWPNRLPGGYLGVDVFFVISCFLITAHLLSEIDRTGRVSFAAFYARRARRILPATLVVLAACLVATLAFASVLDWQNVVSQIAASALFAQNWFLALSSVDYLGATTEASLVQHYWSLSVEEQFYLVWPLIIVGLAAWARRANPQRQRRLLIIGLAALLVSSLTYSLWIGTTEPEPAFFNTAARAWQFAAGGLLAAVGSMASQAAVKRVGVSFLGWAMLAASMLLVSASTPILFAAAVVPVAGTVLIIAAGVPDSPAWWGRVLGARPILFMAELSFSAYLWHWPVLIVAEQLSEPPLSTPVKVALVVVTLALAWATTRFVENPIRFGRHACAASYRTALIAVATAIALVVLPAAATLISLERVLAVTAPASASAAPPAGSQDSALCVGAEALDLDADCVDGPYSSLRPNPLADRGSISILHDIGCATGRNVSGFASCEFGDPDSPFSVALIGDSKAMKMYPAIERLSIENGWRMVTFLKGACAYRASESSDPTCIEFRERLASELEVSGRWDLIVSLGAGSDSVNSTQVNEIRAAWRPLIEQGTPLVVIRDNPQAGDDTRRCVLDNLDAVEVCDLTRGDVLTADAQEAAAEGLSGVTVIDLTDYYCTETNCPVSIGGILVYRDRGHINDEYSYTLAPYIAEPLRLAVPYLFLPR